jgi:hypothetical protein
LARLRPGVFTFCRAASLGAHPGREEITEMANQVWSRDVFDWLVGRGEDIREGLAQFMAHARECIA